MTPAWVRDAVFYQIFPDRFRRSGHVPAPGPLEAWDAPPTRHGFKGGDLYGVAERLDDLRELGVTALYLTPIFASASNHRYHTYDYLHVDPLLGGDEALRALLDGAHERDMRVVLDGVFNHTGRGFWPFHHVLENGSQSPYVGWFHLDEAVLRGERGLDAYPDRRGGGSRSIGYRAWWDMPALPKLNTGDPEVRAYLFGVAEHWIRFGIDGWRLDVPEEIADPSFWAEFRARVKAIDPDAYLVGEIWHEAQEWLTGERFDAVMDYPLAEAILAFVAGERLDRSVIAFHDDYARNVRPIDAREFAAELERIIGLYDPAVTAVQLNLIDSHDTPRFLTMAGGDRDALRLGTFLQATLPGAPCVYYGDEVGMEGGRDPDNRRAYPVEASAMDLDLRAFFRDAFAARRVHAALRAEGIRVLAADGPNLAFLRFGAGAPVVVALATGSGSGPAADDATGGVFTAATLEVAVPELAGRRLMPASFAGWSPTPPVDVGADGRLLLPVAPGTGVVLAAAVAGD